MAKSSSPFAGKNLSEGVGLAESSIEQRLFSSSESKPIKQVSKQTSKQVSFETNKKTLKQGNLETSFQGNPNNTEEDTQAFNLSAAPYKPATFLFTSEELEGIEDLKIELRRKLDLRATKNDIVRCAIHTIIDDFRHNGADSLIVNRIRSKRPR